MLTGPVSTTRSNIFPFGITPMHKTKKLRGRNHGALENDDVSATYFFAQQDMSGFAAAFAAAAGSFEHSALSFEHSALSLEHSDFVQHSALSLQHSALSFAHSALSALSHFFSQQAFSQASAQAFFSACASPVPQEPQWALAVKAAANIRTGMSNCFII